MTNYVPTVIKVQCMDFDTLIMLHLNDHINYQIVTLNETKQVCIIVTAAYV